jgi:hypothetical protein
LESHCLNGNDIRIRIVLFENGKLELMAELLDLEDNEVLLLIHQIIKKIPSTINYLLTFNNHFQKTLLDYKTEKTYRGKS